MSASWSRSRIGWGSARERRGARSVCTSLSVVTSCPPRRAASMSARFADASSGAPHLGALCETSTATPARRPISIASATAVEDRLALAADVRRVDAVVARHDRGTAARARRCSRSSRADRRGRSTCRGRRRAWRRRADAPCAAVRPRSRRARRAPSRPCAGRRDRRAATMLMAAPVAASGAQVLAEGAPGPLDARGVEVVAPVVQRRVTMAGRGAERRRRHAAVAGDVRRHSLAQGRLGQRGLEDRDVGVRVRIDEPRRDVGVGERRRRARRAREASRARRWRRCGPRARPRRRGTRGCRSRRRCGRR